MGKEKIVHVGRSIFGISIKEGKGKGMPLYCFTTEDGETVERMFSCDEVPERVQVGRKAAYRDRGSEHVRGFVVGSKAPVKRGHGRWPMEPCIASGVQPSQAGELCDYLKERGVPTEISKDGDPIYTSAAHRRKALKVRGIHDRNSFD